MKNRALLCAAILLLGSLQALAQRGELVLFSVHQTTGGIGAGDLNFIAIVEPDSTVTIPLAPVKGTSSSTENETVIARELGKLINANYKISGSLDLMNTHILILTRSRHDP